MNRLHHHPLRAAALVLSLALLSGCEGRPDAPSPGQEARSPSAIAAVPAPRRAVDPQRLLGAGRADVQALLGAPALIRREPPAEIWQYQGRACVFDVFLYDEAGEHRVTYLEARDVAARRVDAASCLDDVMNPEATRPAS